jgi:small subunit ribosomal protein S20
MANIKSQIKRNRQNLRRHARNKSIRSELKTRVKRALEAAEAGDESAALEALRVAQKRIDTAAAKGVMHPRTAARRKSQLMRRVDALLGR